MKTKAQNLMLAALAFGTSKRSHQRYNDPATRPLRSFFELRRLANQLVRVIVERDALLDAQVNLAGTLMLRLRRFEDETDRLEAIIKQRCPEEMREEKEKLPVGSVAARHLKDHEDRH